MSVTSVSSVFSVYVRQVTSGYVSLRRRDGTWSSTIVIKDKNRFEFDVLSSQ